MNPKKVEILERLGKYSPFLAPLTEMAKKYIRHCCALDTDDTMLIAHRPWVAPYNFAIIIYPPAKKAWISNYKKKFSIPIPPKYEEFLLSINGCFVDSLDLFGLPPSMQGKTPLLNRRNLQCLALELANGQAGWKNSYLGCNDKFYFGNRSYPHDNLGYFFEGKNTIQAIWKNGQIAHEWTSFQNFLQDELKAAEDTIIEKTPEDWWD